jgi:hypothetical protein
MSGVARQAAWAEYLDLRARYYRARAEQVRSGTKGEVVLSCNLKAIGVFP